MQFSRQVFLTNKTMKLLKTILFVGILGLLPGCFGGLGIPAWGSTGAVLDTLAVYKLTSVEVMPPILDRGGNIRMPESDSIAVWLLDGLNKKHVFRIISRDSLAEPGADKEKNKHSGARLFSKINYVDRGPDGKSAMMTLVLKANINDSILVYSSHDTYWGNTYFFRPDIREVTQDAIEGAVNKLEKLILDAR